MAQDAQFRENVDRLGKITARYKPNRLIIWMIFGGFAWLGGFGFLYTALTMSIPNEGRLGLVAVAICCWMAGLVIFYVSWSRRMLYVQVYEEGLIRVHNEKIELYRWDEMYAIVQSITKHYINGIYTGTSHTYRVQLKGNRSIIFGDELKKVSDLGMSIQKEITKRILPKAVAAYNAGKTIPFGPLSISKEGVIYGKHFLQWTEIEGVQINGGFVGFKKQGKWFNWASVSVTRIPNLYVFLSFVDHIVGVRA